MKLVNKFTIIIPSNDLREVFMSDDQRLYRELYYLLFNRITDAIWALDEGKTEGAREILCQAQRDAEDRYLVSGE